MTIYNLGSINIDHFYRVPHLPAPGETLAAESYTVGLGGKGANQSAAAAKAGARVVHIGAVGSDGTWAVDRLAGWGVDTRHIARLDTPSGHAIINVDAGGENAIVLFPGANWALPFSLIDAALAGAGPSDTLLLQNETAHQAEAAALARELGMRVIYSAAPFDIGAVQAVLENVTVLALNAVEADQLAAAMGIGLDLIDVPELLVTRGAEGAEWRSREGDRAVAAPVKVHAVDTTGAGDTFAGYFAAARDAGRPPAAALSLAGAAASLKVTRHGTADAIPTLDEVEAFRA
ncbi:PfkB family carbohydrate kinase [Defluviimonas sp. WL0024]|uniref:Ribokinase n=2 Tax=Albidovulum TaxID=205889 RepID=A0ABT3J191_9RHOB|nr:MULTISPECIES: PfkB family carbohydrate kinase [Defluviimonas]MCU9848114.1 PfkB family carbohydrate kinase [Defluviimonas sp. WL0024]MCW3781456.1 PfkB family carbohydrate kinase [Defluviimonas salinarum]